MTASLVRYRRLVRYLAGDALRGQRWLAPSLVFLLAVVPGTAVGGSALGCYGFSATVLLPVALWLTIAVSNSEDPAQTSITVVAVGSPLAVRLAKLAVAYLAILGLAAFAVGYPLITSHPAHVLDVLAGILGHLLCGAAGVAFGSLLTRPLVDRLSWLVLGGAAICLVEILVPGFPPVRPVATLLVADAPTRTALFSGLAIAAVETTALSAAVIAAGYLAAQRRVF